MNFFIFSLALICMVITLLVCTVGIVFMATGGERNEKYGTKLMAARVYMQAISLGLVALAFAT